MAEWETVAGEPLVLSAQYPVRGWSSRTTALCGPTGEILVYNPGATVTPELRRKLRAHGQVTLLVAANHFHHLGVAVWLREFPDALVLASTLAIPRLRTHGVEASGYEGIELPWGAHFLEPAGMANGELWLSLATRAGRCWLIGDAFFNVARTPRNPAGAMLWLTGTTPGLRIGATLRWVGLRDPRVYREWLNEALTAEQPEVLVPAHGDLLRDPHLASRLAKLAAARL